MSHITRYEKVSNTENTSSIVKTNSDVLLIDYFINYLLSTHPYTQDMWILDKGSTLTEFKFYC